MAGGGIVGWSAAAALRRHLPALRVTIVSTPAAPASLTDRIGATLPSISGFHSDLGLGESDTVVRAGSSFRVGTQFEGWTSGVPYVHGYGVHGRAIGATSFHLHWLRAALDGEIDPFDSFGLATALGRTGRFSHPTEEQGNLLGNLEYGLHLNPERYLKMMRAYGRHLGVVEREAAILSVSLRAADGFVETLHLGDGSELTGHLFLDCTGSGAHIRSALDDRFEDWDRWLPCDRILIADAAPTPDLPLLDKVVATGAGWRWESAALDRTSHGLVYCSAYQTADEAIGVLAESAGVDVAAHAVTVRQGRRPEPWLRNCISVGDAAVAVEPLEWTNLHLVHSAIDRIISMMPDRDCAPIELAEYNRQSCAEADRIRDFLLLHYITAKRSEAFWTDIASASLPDSLRHTLELFKERGRLPFYEEETFARDSWLAVLLSQGVLPRRVDPLTGGVPLEDAKSTMTQLLTALNASVANLPGHAEHLQTLAVRTRK